MKKYKALNGITYEGKTWLEICRTLDTDMSYLYEEIESLENQAEKLKDSILEAKNMAYLLQCRLEEESYISDNQIKNILHDITKELKG